MLLEIVLFCRRECNVMRINKKRGNFLANACRDKRTGKFCIYSFKAFFLILYKPSRIRMVYVVTETTHIVWKSMHYCASIAARMQLFCEKKALKGKEQMQ
jgi:hypothetical protein